MLSLEMPCTASCTYSQRALQRANWECPFTVRVQIKRMGTATSVGTGRRPVIETCLEDGDELTFRAHLCPTCHRETRAWHVSGCCVWLSQFLSTGCGKCCPLEPQQEGVGPLDENFWVLGAGCGAALQISSSSSHPICWGKQPEI